MSSQPQTMRENGVQPMGSHLQFKVRKIRPMRIESFRRKSLEDVLDSTQKATRKDSVVLLRTGRDGSKLSAPGADANRKLSRKISLRPPTSVYGESSEKRDDVPELKTQFKRKSKDPHKELAGHHVTCECGRKVFLPCVATKQDKVSMDRLNVPLDGSPTIDGIPIPSSASRRRSSLKEIVDFMEDKITIHDAVLQACKEMEHVGEDESVEVVLSRQNAVKCLMAAMRQFPQKTQLLHQACKSLLRQAQLSEATLGYIADFDGITFLYGLLKKFPDHRDLKLSVLDLFACLSLNEAVRNQMAEKGNQSEFLTTMSRDESDVLIVQKCCVVIGNIVASASTALTLMYVGGVHSIIHMMEKYTGDTHVVQHSCTALGTFASHDDTCEHVAEAGATKAVMSAMKTHAHHVGIQESCCWALTCFSRCDTVCKSLMQFEAFETLMETMKSFAMVTSIQEYGCWALCNMSVLASDLSEKQANAAVEVLVECLKNNEDNVELIEQICFALNAYLTSNVSVHTTIVRTGCIRLLIDKMKIFEDNVDIQINSCKLLGNLAVNVDLRRRIEDEKASEVIVTSMFRLGNNLTLQNTGCMALTNLSADVADNKFRILKNGGVASVLNAMRTFSSEEQLLANGLKALCNLLESDQACWSIAEENGVKIIASAIKLFPNSAEIVTFGCLALSSLPRKGTPLTSLQEAVETLKYLYRMSQRHVDVAQNLFTFYENALTAGNSIKTIFDAKAMELVREVMEHFTSIQIQLTGCKIIAQLAMVTTRNMLDASTYDLMLSKMQSFVSEPSIQVVCCGTISYLASTDQLKSLVGCVSPTLSLILDSLRRHRRNTQLNTVALMAIENILRAGTFDVFEPDLSSITHQAMKLHQCSTDIQTSGHYILSNIENKMNDINDGAKHTAV